MMSPSLSLRGTRTALLQVALAAALLASVGSMSPALSQSAPGAAGTSGGRGMQAPKSVGTVTAQTSDVPQVVTLPGRAVAYEVATVRPRVGGLVEAITYEPGRRIGAGAPMFRLETATLDAALAAATAAELGATQARDNAAATVTRYRALENKGVTRADLQAAEVALTQADAALVKANADRQNAALDRDRAIIAAPISGFTSEATTTIGSLVTANQSEPLATITRIDPVYVDVAASSARMLEGRQKVRSGVMTRMDPPDIALTLEDGSVYDTPGEVVSAGSTVSPTTGTVDLRMKFANPDRTILPGQFLRVRMTIGTIRAVLVPQRATTRLADGSLAVFVVREGKAQRVMLTEAGVWNNAWAVTAGVAAGDLLVVDGLSNLNDGQPVAPVAVKLDERGVVVPEAGSQPAPAAQAPPTAAAPAAPVTGWRAWLASARRAVGLAPKEEAASAPPEASARTAAPPETAAAGSPADTTSPPAHSGTAQPAAAPQPAPSLPAGTAQQPGAESGPQPGTENPGDNPAAAPPVPARPPARQG